jgi:hypothetical protein
VGCFSILHNDGDKVHLTLTSHRALERYLMNA